MVAGSSVLDWMQVNFDVPDSFEILAAVRFNLNILESA